MLFKFSEQYQEEQNAENIIDLTEDYQYYRGKMSWKNWVYWVFLISILLIPLIPLYYTLCKARAQRTSDVLQNKIGWTYTWYTNELLNRYFKKPWKEELKQLLQ